jgi:ketosteroid isomerase-like protein
VAHPNEDLIRKAYDAFSSGDRDTIEELFADNIAFHVSGRNLLSGDYVGKDQVFGVFDRLAEITEKSFRTELHDILATNEHAVALQRWTAQREGKASLEDRNVSVFHIQGGKITEVWHHAGDQYAQDEFFS